MKTLQILVEALAISGTCNAFSTLGVTRATTRQSTLTMMARGGRGMKKKSPGSAAGGFSSSGSSAAAGGFASKEWIPIPASTADLNNAQEGKVELIETNAYALKDSLTNPTGAVSVLKHGGETFCFSSSCPSCKIPLSKAKVLPVTSSRPSPLLACTFCKSAYSLRTGKRTQLSPDEIDGGGLFAGLAQSLFKASGNTNPLPMYQLGEKDGKLLIALD